MFHWYLILKFAQFFFRTIPLTRSCLEFCCFTHRLHASAFGFMFSILWMRVNELHCSPVKYCIILWVRNTWLNNWHRSIGICAQFWAKQPRQSPLMTFQWEQIDGRSITITYVIHLIFSFDLQLFQLKWRLSTAVCLLNSSWAFAFNWTNRLMVECKCENYVYFCL